MLNMDSLQYLIAQEEVLANPIASAFWCLELDAVTGRCGLFGCHVGC